MTNASPTALKGPKVIAQGKPGEAGRSPGFRAKNEAALKERHRANRANRGRRAQSEFRNPHPEIRCGPFRADSLHGGYPGLRATSLRSPWASTFRSFGAVRHRTAVHWSGLDCPPPEFCSSAQMRG